MRALYLYSDLIEPQGHENFKLLVPGNAGAFLRDSLKVVAAAAAAGARARLAAHVPSNVDTHAPMHPCADVPLPHSLASPHSPLHCA